MNTGIEHPEKAEAAAGHARPQRDEASDAESSRPPSEGKTDRSKPTFAKITLADNATFLPARDLRRR